MGSLQNQIGELPLQDKLGKHNSQENVESFYEPLTDTIKDTSRDITKAMTDTFVKNNKTLENLNYKLLETMNDRGKLASFLMSPLSKLTNPEHTGQFKLLEDPRSNRVNDLLIHYTKPVALYINLLTFSDIDEKFEIQGDLLKTVTDGNYNVDLANSQDRKTIHGFAEEIYFDEKAPGNKSPRDRSLILLKSLDIIVFRISTISFTREIK